jgi:hypothetical protein
VAMLEGHLAENAAFASSVKDPGHRRLQGKSGQHAVNCTTTSHVQFKLTCNVKCSTLRVMSAYKSKV